MTRTHTKVAGKSRMAGLSIIELMVALTISAVLIFGATQVYVDSRAAYNVNETVARLQENARYAMSVIEPDLRMANYWGLTRTTLAITGRAAQSAGTSAIANNAEANYCGNNLAVDLDRTLQADDNSYVLSANSSKTANCDTVAGTGWATSPMLSADTLTVRRASTIVSPATNQVIQLCSDPLSATLYSNGTGTVCPATSQINNLIVNAYYIDNNSSVGAGTPSLRRKNLQTDTSNVIRFVDQEVIAGVEDMQVQFGVDTSGTGAGIASRFVNPNQVAGLPAGSTIVAVRVWLLVRSDTPEIGFVDNRTYVYGDRLVANGTVSNLNVAANATKAFQPSLDTSTALASVRHYRRLLVCRTFMIRNTLPP